jgi:cellulose synthase/poly-beta-1,6-N-acetylglucosamine synthase-like glycosyltransferase
MASSVLYVTFYALVSLFPSRTSKHQPSAISPQPSSSFLILFPAYKEDSVIVHSVRQFLEQTYPKGLYEVVVISDHMQDDTNELLRQLPITLLTPQFEKSSKAKAMQYAIKEIKGQFNYIVILDADNVVLPDFLEQVNVSCQQGYRAIQCHRCAKNCDNDVAVLDGVSEEINNTIFRKAHNTIGLSSALIGSGMCFTFEWFKQHVDLLNSAVEDRELESLLLQEKIFIKFEENIHVFDEKVSNHENFERQRLRWLNGQLQSLLIMLPNIPHAIATININYIDKTIQQALIPRSILLFLTPLFSLIMLCIAPVWSLKWWILFLVLCLSLYIAIPSQMRNSAVFGKLSSFPALALKMLKNLFNLNKNNKDFLHTTHGNE